jgi:rod shape-determining protein MreB
LTGVTHTVKWLDRLRGTVLVDIGTARTRLCSEATGMLDEPTVVATDRATGQPTAWGHGAIAALRSKGADAALLHPVSQGIVADFHGYRFILESLVRRACGKRRKRGWLRPLIFIAVPAVLSKVDRAVLADACRQVGAPDCRFVEASTAAAVGVGLPIQAVGGQMVVEAGAGRCTATVFSWMRPVVGRTEGIGGKVIDASLDVLLREAHQMAVGAEALRVVRERYCSLLAAEGERAAVRGMDMATNLPRTVHLERDSLREAAWPTVRRLCDLAAATLAETPPELAGDLLVNGIGLAGGLANLEGLAAELERFTGCPVHRPDAPEWAVIRGLGTISTNPERCASLWRRGVQRAVGGALQQDIPSKVEYQEVSR